MGAAVEEMIMAPKSIAKTSRIAHKKRSPTTIPTAFKKFLVKSDINQLFSFYLPANRLMAQSVWQAGLSSLLAYEKV
jgi:hypothetical protein